MTPDELLHLAQSEASPSKTSKSKLWPYLESVHVLREKNWGWRQIQDWLTTNTEPGTVPTDRKQIGVLYFQWCEANGKKAVRTR